MRGAMDLSHPPQLFQVSTGNWIGSETARTQISTYIGCQHHWRRLSLPRHVGPPPSFFHTFSPLLCCLLCLHFLPVSVPLPSDAVIFFAQVPAAGSWPVVLPCISLLQPAPPSPALDFCWGDALQAHVWSHPFPTFCGPTAELQTGHPGTEFHPKDMFCLTLRVCLEHFELVANI